MNKIQSGKDLVTLYLEEEDKKSSALGKIESAKRNFSLAISLLKSKGCELGTFILILEDQQQKLESLKEDYKNYPKVIKQINNLLNEIDAEKRLHILGATY